MLRGNIFAKVDEKGRLKLPAAFRAVIEPEYGPEFFVTSLRGESVRIYPMSVWQRVEERLARLPSMNPSVMRFKNAVNYYGQTVSMDGQGRVLLHPLVRDKARLNGEVTVIGLQDHLEVWNRVTFEERLSLSDADLRVVSEMGI